MKSGYLNLDVTDGREKLAKRLARGERPRVRIEGYVDCEFEHDDGTSQQFCVVVTRLEEVPENG